MKARRVVVVLVLALLAYFVIIGWFGVILVEQSRWTLRTLGVVVFVLPVIGVYVVYAELRFGQATQRLVGHLPDAPPDLPRRPSGRVERAAADAWFAECKAAVEAAPDDWQAWYRLAEAYDLAGDRRRARATMRRAIAMQSPPAS
jgi:Tetratricopeptide repeat